MVLFVMKGFLRARATIASYSAY